jgi:HEPN domain-containing protein
MNEKTIKYWQEISEYDLITAEAMLNTKRYLYVGFMCHQAIEKILKAYYVKVKNETPPYLHDLEKLTEYSGLINFLSKEQLAFIEELNPLNIEARYPKFKNQMFQVMKGKDCEYFLKKSGELREWISKKL